eukprot:1633159-Prymnesium_polylepis.1
MRSRKRVRSRVAGGRELAHRIATAQRVDWWLAAGVERMQARMAPNTVDEDLPPVAGRRPWLRALGDAFAAAARARMAITGAFRT